EGLKTYPQLNSTIDGDKVVYHGSENIGMAADTERGLVVPVIKNAGDLNLAGLARQIGGLGGRAKATKLTPDGLAGATCPITTPGSGGALCDTPIVPAPQVGILGTGTITKRPVVVQNAEGDDTIAIRQMMYLFLSYDHRMVDGGDAARFLTFMKKRLEEGAFEGELGLCPAGESLSDADGRPRHLDEVSGPPASGALLRCPLCRELCDGGD